MSLGLVASGKRSIKSGAEYEQFFTAKAEGNEIELLAQGSVYDTLKLMHQVVAKTLSQTKAIAARLKGSNREQTCRNIWDFLYNHVQYKKDHARREQLRTPIRTWRDRRTGVDCDCYSIFASSVLTNLGIPHAFRMAAYKGDYQHVYVIVSGSPSIIIDPVVDQFNYEAPYSKKHDHMTKVSMLNGLGACSSQTEGDRIRVFVETQQIVAEKKVPTREFLVQHGIPFDTTIDELTNQTVYLVNTAAGKKIMVPTIITPEQSKQLITLVTNPEAEQPAAEPEESTKKKFVWPWWWFAIGAGVLVLLTGDDQNEVKSGLNGVGKVSGQLDKKMRTIHI